MTTTQNAKFLSIVYIPTHSLLQRNYANGVARLRLILSHSIPLGGVRICDLLFPTQDFTTSTGWYPRKTCLKLENSQPHLHDHTF